MLTNDPATRLLSFGLLLPSQPARYFSPSSLPHPPPCSTCTRCVMALAAMEWTWPGSSSKPTTTSFTPQLEHQFLPAASTLESSWGDDPAKLQQLMMGSVRPSPAASTRSTSARDLAGLFDLDTKKPLPSGWERCLDLKSGELFIVKSAPNVNAGLDRHNRSHASQQENSRHTETTKTRRPSESDSRQDWCVRWLQGSTAVLSQEATKHEDGGSVKLGDLSGETQEDERSGGDAPCLDLDLKLTSEQPEGRKSGSRDVLQTSEKASGKRKFIGFSQPERSQHFSPRISSPPPSRTPLKEENMLQQWKWQPDGKASTQEATESSMATAACGKCLMYVLLKKTNPTCPRCGNPIILDCTWQSPSKRARMELSSDDLSLSTSSSR